MSDEVSANDYSRLEAVSRAENRKAKELRRKQSDVCRLAAALVQANEFAGMEAIAEGAIVLYEHIETKLRVLGPLSQKSFPPGHIAAKD